MRIACLCALLFAAGCAAPARVAAPDAPQEARADSLLALPSDSLTSADVAWLSAYAARQSSPDARARERARAVFAVLGVLAVVGVALGVWAAQEAAVGG